MTIAEQIQAGIEKGFEKFKLIVGAAPAAAADAIADLKALFTDLQGKFTQLQADHKTAQTTIGTLQGEKTTLEGQVTKLTGDLKAANDKNAELEKTIKDPKGAISQGAAELAAKQGVGAALDLKPGDTPGAEGKPTVDKLRAQLKATNDPKEKGRICAQLNELTNPTKVAK